MVYVAKRSGILSSYSIYVVVCVVAYAEVCLELYVVGYVARCVVILRSNTRSSGSIRRSDARSSMRNNSSVVVGMCGRR